MDVVFFLTGLFFSNVNELHDTLTSVVGYIPRIWGIWLKFFVPPVILILFANLAGSETATGESLFGHYEGYVTWPYQVLGFVVVCLAAAVVLIGGVMPSVYSCFIPLDVSQFDVPIKDDPDEPKLSGPAAEEPTDYADVTDDPESPEAPEADFAGTVGDNA